MVCDGNDVLFYEGLLQHLAKGITVFTWLSILLSLNPFQLIKIQYKLLLFVCFKLTRGITHPTFNVLKVSFFLGLDIHLGLLALMLKNCRIKLIAHRKGLDEICILYIICMWCEEMSENTVLKICSLRSLKFDLYFWGFLSDSPTDASWEH